MTAIADKELLAWEKQGQKVAEKLRARLAELDMERGEIIVSLHRVEGKPTPATNGAGTRSAFRTDLPRHILQLLEEAGETGLNSGRIIEGLKDELGPDDVDRGRVLTHLSRMKKRGQIEAIGDAGLYTYRIPAAAAPAEEAS